MIIILILVRNGQLCNYVMFMFSDLTGERMPPPSRRPDRSEVLQFDQNKLNHVPTTEKVVLPSKQGTTCTCIHFSINYITFSRH